MDGAENYNDLKLRKEVIHRVLESFPSTKQRDDSQSQREALVQSLPDLNILPCADSESQVFKRYGDQWQVRPDIPTTITISN